MFSTQDTIVAIATPPGRGGIGVVRVSGPEAHRIAQELTRRDPPFQPRHATLATVRLQPARPQGTSASLAEAFGGGGSRTPRTTGGRSTVVGSALRRTILRLLQLIQFAAGIR